MPDRRIQNSRLSLLWELSIFRNFGFCQFDHKIRHRDRNQYDTGARGHHLHLSADLKYKGYRLRLCHHLADDFDDCDGDFGAVLWLLEYGYDCVQDECYRAEEMWSGVELGAD